MSSLKRAIFIALSFGAGFAIISFIVVGSLLWYQARPKTWNTKAITASYKNADTQGENNLLVFYYSLSNNTNYDYTIQDNKNMYLALKLINKDISGTKGDSGSATIEYPLVIPAKHSLHIQLQLAYPGPKQTQPIQTKDDRNKYHKEVEAYVSKELTNLNGFVLFDEKHHYEIEFPRGW